MLDAAVPELLRNNWSCYSNLRVWWWIDDTQVLIMSIFNHEKEDYIAPSPEPVKKPSGWKIIITTAGALFNISHLGSRLFD